MTIFNTQAQPGQSYNPITGQTGTTQNLGGQVNGTYQDLSRQAGSAPFQNAKNAANAGINNIGTGYLYGVGGQTLGQQSRTYTPSNPADMRGNVGVGPRNPGQMTWDQWAQQMQKNYGTGQGGSLGGTSGGGPLAPPPPVGGTVYPAGYTGYGNSHIGGPANQPSAPLAPPPTSGGGVASHTNGGVPLAPAPSGLSAVQQLINQANTPVVKPSGGVPLAQRDPGTGFVVNPTLPPPIAPAPINPFNAGFVIQKPGFNTR